MKRQLIKILVSLIYFFICAITKDFIPQQHWYLFGVVVGIFSYSVDKIFDVIYKKDG